jgi:UDP-3-O-[3-hydroxymyristoyl] glucosamine N-acyltransferase
MAGMTVGELAEAVGGTVWGPDDVVITGAASVTEATPGDVVLAESAKYLAAAEKSRASAVVAADGSCGRKPTIRVADPRRAFAEILRRLASQPKPPRPGIDPSCRVGARLTCGDGAAVGYGCWIGDDVTIGERTAIHPFVYLGDGVRIGADSVIYPRVVIYQESELGSRVTVHAGTVIGSDGFGYLQVGNELHKVPQIGKVIIEDDVEIGANVTIDRAKTGATRIGRGTKIDNQVQIAHNAKVGSGCVIVAQAGLSGSVELGNGVTIAGQVGIKEHVRIGDGAVVGGQAGVFGDLPAGGTYSGFPARPHREHLRAQAAFLRLPETQKAVVALQKEVDRLKRRLTKLGGDEIEPESE